MHNINWTLEAHSRFHGYTFWKHRGVQSPNVGIMSDDGVHLNDIGNWRLATSLRGAIISTRHELNGKIVKGLSCYKKSHNFIYPSIIMHTFCMYWL